MSEKKTGVTVYVTKYALTKGVIAYRGATVEGRLARISGLTLYYQPDWYLSERDALAQAEVMRSRKVESLRKQLAKLEKLTFKTRERA